MKNVLLVFGLFFALLACNNNPVPDANLETTAESSSDLKSALIGRWDTNYVLVAMKSVNNSKMDGTMEVQPHKQTQEPCQTKVQSVFLENGTYLSEYRDENKKLIIKSAGKWSAEGNTLILNQEFPKTKTLRYEATIGNNVAEFRSTIDFDHDGEADDLMYCQVRRSGC